MYKYNSAIIERLMWKCSYLKQDGTSGYYADFFSADVLRMKKASKEKMIAMAGEYQRHLQVDGIQLLPSTLYLADIATSRSGRGAKPRIGILKGKFRAFEQSPYKQNKPYQVSTSIWAIDGYGCYFYGTPAISQKDGKVGKDNGDLLVIHTTNWVEVDVYIFRGMGKNQVGVNPLGLLDVLSFLCNAEKSDN